MDRIEKWKQEIDDFFKNMTRKEFIKHLQDAGFTVVEGNGRVIDENGNDITGEILKD